MPKPIKYFTNTPAEEALEALLKWSPCKEAVVHFKNTHGKTIKDMAENTPNGSWAAWALLKYGEELASEVRKIYISKITEPVMALRLYVDLPFWTDEEDRLLEGIFKSEYRKVDKQLTDGTLIREKISQEVLDGSN